MAISDKVVSNLTTIYVAAVAGTKAYGLVIGRSFGCGFVLAMSTTVVGLILIGTLTWDLYSKATYAFNRERNRHPHLGNHEACKGGICWHGVAVQSPVSEVRFRLPQHIPYAPL